MCAFWELGLQVGFIPVICVLCVNPGFHECLAGTLPTTSPARTMTLKCEILIKRSIYKKTRKLLNAKSVQYGEHVWRWGRAWELWPNCRLIWGVTRTPLIQGPKMQLGHRRDAEPPLGPGSVVHRRKGWPDRWQEVIEQDMFIFSENRHPI